MTKTPRTVVVSRTGKVHLETDGQLACGTRRRQGHVRVGNSFRDVTCLNCRRKIPSSKFKLTGWFAGNKTLVPAATPAPADSLPLSEPWLAPPDPVETVMAKDVLVNQRVYVKTSELRQVPFTPGEFYWHSFDGWYTVLISRRYASHVELEFVGRFQALKLNVHPEQCMQLWSERG